MSRHRSSSRRPPPEIGLHMECEEEELEPSQVAYYSKAEREYNEVQSKLDNYIKKMKAEVIEKGEHCLVLQLNGAQSGVVSPSHGSAPSAGGKPARQSAQASQNYQQMPGQGILTRSNTNAGTNAYLVMDPRLSFVVGQIPASSAPPEQVTAPASSKTVPAGRTRQQSSITGSVMVTTRAKSNLKKQGSTQNESEGLTPTMIRTRQQEKTKNQTQQSSPQTSPQQQQVFTGSVSSGPGSFKIKVNAKPGSIPSANTNESNAVGGLSAGGKTYKSNNDDSSSSKSTADSREVTFSRLTGKIFPSLVVVARPHLKLKYIPQSTVQQERSALDAKVKGVLMYSSTKFIEWLIQQGLIRSEQSCQTHVNNDLSPVKLKLGMYSDVSKFPYSGGYVWISDCCPQQFVSVFSGSIFEGAPHPPTTLLKLIYHWACQTNVQNVVQWVKVDNLYLKNFYTNMRAVCTQAVHEKFKKLGGPRKKIEVGVISLGTTSQDGNKRQVKVEVLGVMDQENKSVRLRAVEPLSEERSFKRRFVKILEPLEEWVHKDSVILTDFTVAKAALNAMGFNSVYQVTNDSKLSNQNVMEYLRRIVPRMFQNTLSLLSRQIIQQFLDELVWREMWGPIPSQAFITIISHLAEQTKLDVTENFLVRLNKVATNPFKLWNYSAWKTLVSGTAKPGSKSQQKAASSHESILEVTIDSLEHQSSGKGIRTRKRAAEQPLSETVTTLSSAKKPAKISTKEKQKKEEKAFRKESGDNLSEEIIKFINEGNQIPLENYYYGSRMGDEEINHAATGPFNVKCCVCNKRFTENVVLMKHMILHCQTEPILVIDLKKVHQCEYCFIGFNTGAALKVHMQEMHSLVDGKITSNFLCHICEEKFNGRIDLVYHMHRTHVQLEMPYECGVCHFRTSVYRVFIDHFTQVHSHEDHVFCPYCLKSVTFSFKGEVIMLNVLFYISHLEKHQRRTLIKDCNRCQLSFIHKGILDQHTEADHASWKDEIGVIPIEKIPTGIFMPEPSGVIKSSPAVKPFKCPKTKNMYVMNKFKSLQVYGIDEDMACVECEGSLTFSEHFTGNFNCLKCRYASCCEKAMVEHFSIFHETPYPQFTKGRPVTLPQEMHCLCGYSSSSGNRIAKHLALCERESAYPSREAVNAVLEAKGVSDAYEKSKQGQNMLNMLGLVRKSPEVMSAGGGDSVKMGAEGEEEVDEEEERDRAEASASTAGKKGEETSESAAAVQEAKEEEEKEEVEGDEEEVEGDEEEEEEEEEEEMEEEEEVDEEDTREDLSVLTKKGLVTEVSRAHSQEESDTSESQQDNSVISMLELTELKEKMEEGAAVTLSALGPDENTDTERPMEESMEISDENNDVSVKALQEHTTGEEKEDEVEIVKVGFAEKNAEEECGTEEAKMIEIQPEESERMEVSEVESALKEWQETELGDSGKKNQAKEREVCDLLTENIPGNNNEVVESCEAVNSGEKKSIENIARSLDDESVGPSNRHSKSSKKSKGTKKNSEKAPKDANSSDSQEILRKQSSPKQGLKKAHDSEQQSLHRVSDIVKNNVKKPKLEKRKQDGSEWKALKKVDYQRLETVMEEGQLSSEEASSKHNFLESGKSDSGSDIDRTVADFAPIKSKKSWIYSLMSLTDHSEAPKPVGDPPKKVAKLERLQPKQGHKTPPQPEHLIKCQPNSEKSNIVNMEESHGEPNEALPKELAQNKRSVILSGMMEILPIFSNDKFVCSRDAISIEEYEDLEMDRNSGKTLLETKNGKDSRSIDIKPFISANCMKKENSFDGGFMERLGDFKEVTERKLRYKVFTDRNVYQETSSPFINSLLVLTPFSNERERILNEEKLKQNVDEGRFSAANDFSSDLEGDGKYRLSLKICFGVTMTTLCLLTMLLTIAWKTYKPPCFVDSILEVLPFVHPRRSYFQRCFDKLITLLSTFRDFAFGQYN